MWPREELAQFLAGTGIPGTAGSPVFTCDDDSLAIRAVGRRVEAAGLVLKLAQFLAGAGVPNADGPIVPSRWNLLAIRAVDRRPDIADVTLEPTQFFADVSVPDTGGLVRTDSDDSQTIWTIDC